ncbi:hypothetical protein CC86DRAFT_414901 [Ophiobolus disseminans]|uniref:SMODS and SLOG-associating 2TM effector domain-containing protein n=1 Tax=Ophiobolus disseminans TaxID=1469910 RepID=A0A6A7AJK2_9PLEO|nr:hypothetical protein CC86DRAFT_414901 [Ophiobolus disseminans]
MNFLPSVLRPHSRAHDIEKDGISSNTSSFPPPLAARATFLEPEAMNQLNTFRHMVGIHSTQGFVPQTPNAKGGFFSDISHNTLHFDGRAAPNLGIYNRVCHRESQAKRGYKFAAMLINGCLGLQIVVAAALTAMGAANSNHVGITAFGAINTVIAGILTYLKGSGLPNRIRYYENEWKRVREYIEQRERDFSRQDCRLDVNEVVSAIEAMYEQVKSDIQTNTPDNYISVSDIRARATVALNQTPQFNASAHASAGRSKFEELELKYGHKVTDFLESVAHKEEERLRRIEGGVDANKARALAALQEGRDAGSRELDEAKIGARDWGMGMQDKGAKMAERELEHARSGVRDWEKDIEEKGARTAERELEHAKSGLLSRGLSFARELEHTKNGVLQRSNDLSRDLDAAKVSAVQRGQDFEKDIQTKTARFADAERDLEREAERTREAAQRAGDSIHQAGDALQRAGESIGRVTKAVDDEMQPHRRA